MLDPFSEKALFSGQQNINTKNIILQHHDEDVLNGEWPRI